MKIIRYKLMLIFLFILIILIGSGSNASADNETKTIVVVTDELDFELVEKLYDENKMSLGLMNTRTANVFKNSSESYFMTIAASRRVDLEEGLFKGVVKNDKGELLVKGYKDIINELDSEYKGFSQEIDLLGDVFKENAINVAYIGNDESAIIAADKNGIIHHGDNAIEYDEDWLITKTDYMLENSGVLVLAYEINNSEERTQILKNYLQIYSMYNIIVFPREISGDIDYMRNITLVPVIYSVPNISGGILISDSTKREGLILNMDILPDLANIYDIKLRTSIGHEIDSINGSDAIEVNKHNLEEYLNSIVIKYIFHGAVVLVQLYVLYDVLIKKHNNYKLYSILMNGLLISIFLSVILGALNINRNVILYWTVLVISSIGLTLLLNRIEINGIEIFSICTNVAMLIGVYFNPDIIYNSSFGFNNVVSGGRFYGLNNESMGVLLVTSIITFFAIKRKIKSKAISALALVIYFPVVIIALSGRYAANFGGYLTSIVLFIVLLYITVFDKRMNKRNVVVLIAVGLCIFVLNLYFDAKNPSGSHAGSLVSRIMALGFHELIDMIIKKVKQLTLMSISPPWSIIALIQIFFVRKFLIKKNELIEKVKLKDAEFIRKLFAIFIISFVALVLNDTGIVAFVYMNTYLVAELVGLHNTKRRLHC